MGRILRVTAAAVALALIVVTVTLVGSAAVDRDVMVRRGRGASQRLDTFDGIAHAHEVSEPDTAPAGCTVEETATIWSQTPPFGGPSAVLVPASAAIGPLDAGVAHVGPIPADAPLVTHVRPTRGRSPPIA